MEKVSTMLEVVGYLRARKKYWLGPIVVLLAVFGLLIALGESSGLGPFIYPLF